MHEQALLDFEDKNYPARYDVYDLRAMTGVTTRTVHYYVYRCLIPHAIGAGPAARYTYEHIVRVKVIRQLKQRGLTLREIGVLLDGSTVRELHGFANGRDPGRTIATVRQALRRRRGAPPPGAEPFTRVPIFPGVELLVSKAFLPRAAVHLDALGIAIADIFDVLG